MVKAATAEAATAEAAEEAARARRGCSSPLPPPSSLPPPPSSLLPGVEVGVRVREGARLRAGHLHALLV